MELRLQVGPIAAGRRMVGIEPQRLFIGCKCFLRATALREDNAEVALDLGIPRVESRHSLIHRYGIRRFAGEEQGRTPALERLK